MGQTDTVSPRRVLVERATRLISGGYLLTLMLLATMVITGRLQLTLFAWGCLIVPAVGFAHNVWTLARARRATDPLHRDTFFKEGALGVVVTLIYLGSTLYTWAVAPAAFTGW
ncbi:hypothetical protein [Actinoplanes flavus]|uniref:Uncharacterized protein n=1 Tax=Actinoplanes flavus TaxID=2820290 RepID=A0ABS3UKK7_9ACTN|nr:hypothetical protein [Actinoplanes flavus]MBO3739317.1 hypothetical protein [Actinoplanes flavus]